jgi:hypothetical protein
VRVPAVGLVQMRYTMWHRCFAHCALRKGLLLGELCLTAERCAASLLSRLFCLPGIFFTNLHLISLLTSSVFCVSVFCVSFSLFAFCVCGSPPKVVEATHRALLRAFGRAASSPSSSDPSSDWSRWCGSQSVQGEGGKWDFTIDLLLLRSPAPRLCVAAPGSSTSSTPGLWKSTDISTDMSTDMAHLLTAFVGRHAHAVHSRLPRVASSMGGHGAHGAGRSGCGGYEGYEPPVTPFTSSLPCIAATLSLEHHHMEAGLMAMHVTKVPRLLRTVDAALFTLDGIFTEVTEGGEGAGGRGEGGVRSGEQGWGWPLQRPMLGLAKRRVALDES